MDERNLYKEIVKVWGEHGAHADIYRELCKRAGVPILDVTCVQCDKNREREGDPRRAIGEPCDICEGSGIDYLGRQCRHSHKEA